MKRVTATIVMLAAVLSLAAGEAWAAGLGGQAGAQRQRTRAGSVGTSAGGSARVYQQLCDVQSAMDRLRSRVNGTDQDRLRQRQQDCDPAAAQDCLQDRLRQRVRECDPTCTADRLQDRDRDRLRNRTLVSDPATTRDRTRTRYQDRDPDSLWQQLWRWSWGRK